jgi:formate dehydrogenase beta subunit
VAPPPVPDAQWLWDNEPCRAACPVHTDAGAYVTAIAEGRHRDAYLIARRPNPFPSICGRVCAAPCETACRRGAIDAPVGIRALKRFVSERFGVESFAGSAAWHEGHAAVPPATLGSVGVVGGGPAGLAAAHDLRIAGHPVTVYEAEDRLGGMMVLGIPEYRLARGLISREIDAILELGVDARTGCTVGVDVTLDELLRRHDALFVAVGATRGRMLDIPGHELDGVLRAMEFLLNVNRGFRVELGERVVVVGGGNVAFDVARTALRTSLDVARAAVRAGVGDVTAVALESAEEMPAAAEEIAAAVEEGVRIVHRRGPSRIVGDGRVSGLETIGVASVFDENGRFNPTFVPDTEEVLPADSVILAVGQVADVSFVGDDLSVARTRQGGLGVDDGLRTTHPRIWAGGDVAFGPRNLIDAIADGCHAAASIHATLAGGPQAVVTSVPVSIGLAPRTGFRRLSTGYDAIPRVPVPAVPIERRVGFAEVETGYDETGAVLEGLRCLRCFDNVMLRPELCILCGLCVDVCPYDCITIVRADRVGAGSQSQSALLLDEEQCIRCGLCVNRCPPGALLMVHACEHVEQEMTRG